MSRPEYRHTFQFQISVYFVGLTTIIVILTSWILYSEINRYFDDDLGKNLIGVAKSSADLMEADLLSFLEPGSENGSFYLSLQKNLQSLQQNFDVARVYVVDKSLLILVDSQKGEAIGKAVPHLQSNLLEINKVLNGEASYSTLYRGFDGSLYKSAFAPVKDLNGEVYAIACVDASPAFLQVMDSIRNTILVISIISLIAALAAAILLTQSIVNPLKRLVEAAQRIGEGNFSTPIKLDVNNELGFLGNTFNSMQENIKIYQYNLEELRQSAEKRADKLELYNYSILQSVDNGVITIDLDGVITVFNTKAGKLLNISPDSAIDIDFRDALGTQHSFLEKIEADWKNPKTSDQVELTLTDRKEKLMLNVQSSLLRDTRDNVIGVNWVLTDVTELRKLQGEIEEKERMAYLGMLSAAVAHEIRNPLNSIELYIGLLKRKLDKDRDARSSIEKIREEIKALNGIVTNILIFAKPGIVKEETFSVDRLLRDSVFLAENALTSKSIDLTLDIPDEQLLLNGDISQLKQAILNILLNSIDAMNNGGQLNITAKPVTTESQSPHLQIRVSDNGSGIPPEDLERIFDPFYSTRSQGTGLGLSIVRNIVQAHNGNVYVESSGSMGTIFIIDLPKGDS